MPLPLGDSPLKTPCWRRGQNKSLNRNILECKLFCHPRVKSSIAVLIETYWNVNEIIPGRGILDFFVLIETYWNVNEALV